jgi:hypothetical protein
MKIPRAMLKPDFSEQAQAFANVLADELSGAGVGGSRESEALP